MPYKSEAQRRLFHWLESQGKLAHSKVREYDVASRGKKLPEYVKPKRKAFGGEIAAKAGARCPVCDYPLDQIPVAMDAGEACPRCGFGNAKDVPQKARGGEVMDETSYRARGGEMTPGRFAPAMKELYISKKRHPAPVDDGRVGFARALRTHRRR